MKDRLIIKGARQHNLKNIDLEIPRDKLVVLTGLSGSGKSSLAFDTIYAEGQRRYVESLSAYARQFLGQMDKPDVDYIEGLSPAISIDQKTTSRNPRSTVGTVTEIYDYLRLLYARAGRPHCPECGEPITQQTVQQMVDALMNQGEGAKLTLLAPVIRGKKGEHTKLLDEIRRDGYVRVRVDGVPLELAVVCYPCAPRPRSPWDLRHYEILAAPYPSAESGGPHVGERGAAITDHLIKQIADHADRMPKEENVSVYELSPIAQRFHRNGNTRPN